ncbi:MAG: tRNA (adenosine(37)-N6)-dimethylallyltransferase MiaA [Candidatus Zixiibacteriota bacterium]
MNDWVLVVLGPTCVGKTQVSLKLADILSGEIVSFDSRQVYRFMDIGTAKPTEEEQKRIPHHLIGLVSPGERFTAADYGKQARKAIGEIIERKRQPIAVGGSGLYLKALIEGFFQGPQADWKVRERLQREAQESAGPHLFDRLKRVDPKAADRIHPNDLVRTIRALEVYELTGRPITEWQQEGSYELFPMRFIKIGLTMERQRFYQKIDQRVDEMMAQGFLEEVTSLRNRGFTLRVKALRTVGYQELFAYLDGELDLSGAVERIKLNTRHYAKRQLTWFKKDQDIAWLDVTDDDLIEEILKRLGQN